MDNTQSNERIEQSHGLTRTRRALSFEKHNKEFPFFVYYMYKFIDVQLLGAGKTQYKQSNQTKDS